MSKSDYEVLSGDSPAKTSFQERVAAFRKREIIATSLELFAAKGCFEFRVGDVASREGIAKGSVYNTFRSKEEMLCSALEELYSRALSEYERQARDLSEEATAASRLIIMAKVLLGSDGGCRSLFNQLPCSLANMHRLPLRNELVELIGSVIEKGFGIPADGLSQTGLAELFIGLVVSRPMREMARQAGVAQTAQTAVNLFLHGVGLPYRA